MSYEGLGHEETLDSIPAYAVGGLDPGDAAAVEQHLRGCEACRRELASYEQLRGDLGLAAPDASLPEGARGRLLERAGNTGSLSPESPSENSHSENSLSENSHRPLRRLSSENSHSESSVRPPRRAHRPWRRLTWVTAAASLLLVLFLGGATWQLYQQNQRMSEEIASQQQTISSVVDLMERADLAVSDTRTSESGVRTRIYEAREGDVGMVVFDSLPPLPEDQVYQLWMQTGEGWRSKGTFRPEGEGMGSHHKLLEPAGGFEQYETVAVAAVPEGDPPESPPISEMIVLESIGTTFASAGGAVPGSNASADPGERAPIFISYEVPEKRQSRLAQSSLVPYAEGPWRPSLV